MTMGLRSLIAHSLGQTSPQCLVPTRNPVRNSGLGFLALVGVEAQKQYGSSGREPTLHGSMFCRHSDSAACSDTGYGLVGVETCTFGVARLISFFALWPNCSAAKVPSGCWSTCLSRTQRLISRLRSFLRRSLAIAAPVIMVVYSTNTSLPCGEVGLLYDRAAACLDCKRRRTALVSIALWRLLKLRPRPCRARYVCWLFFSTGRRLFLVDEGCSQIVALVGNVLWNGIILPSLRSVTASISRSREGPESAF